MEINHERRQTIPIAIATKTAATAILWNMSILATWFSMIFVSYYLFIVYIHTIVERYDACTVTVCTQLLHVHLLVIKC